MKKGGKGEDEEPLYGNVHVIEGKAPEILGYAYNLDAYIKISPAELALQAQEKTNQRVCLMKKTLIILWWKCWMTKRLNDFKTKRNAMHIELQNLKLQKRKATKNRMSMYCE